MAWRFKASKYKNAAPRLVKREEWIGDISAGNLMQSCGNHIKASCLYMAFNVDSAGGGNLGVLPVSTTGRIKNGLPLLTAHGDFVTDFDFSPFDDHLLATCSADSGVKVWLLPEEKDLNVNSLSCLTAKVEFPKQEKKVENILWHPVADGVLAISCQKDLKVLDVLTQQEKYCFDCHKDLVQSISWRGDGTSVVTSCRDKILRVIDPRSGDVKETNGHQNVRDSRAIWLGTRDNILTTGFSASRSREIRLWDVRSLKSSICSKDIDNNNGTIIPLYDADTCMLFLGGKGDSMINYLEITDKEPFLNENLTSRTEQIKGLGLVPKRAVSVMEGEVNRVLVLSKHAVIPLPYIVPRKNYQDFHSDLFPDTPSDEPVLNTEQWFSGQNAQRKTKSLNPRERSPVGQRRGNLFTADSSLMNGKLSNTASKESTLETVSEVKDTTSRSEVKDTTSCSDENKSVISNQQNIPDEHSSKKSESTVKSENKVKSESKQPKQQDEDEDDNIDDLVEQAAAAQIKENQTKAQAKIFSGVHQSKFKHLKATIAHRSKHVENIRKVNRTVPGESDFFAVNRTRCVVPVEGAGGLLSIFELNKPGRLMDTGIPVLQHKSKVTDYVWDPFDDQRLVVACDDAKIWIWDLPKDGLTETLTEPNGYLMGHMEKIYFVRFHPLAKDVLVSSAYDFTVRIWDLNTMTEKMQLMEHPDQVFSAAWSPDGKYLCTICKDGKIRVFNPRMSPEPLVEGQGPEGSRGARAVFVLNGQYILITGFNRKSERQISLHDVGDLEKPLETVEIDANPSILVPFYDEDSKTCLVTGRGESFVYGFEVCEKEPYLFPLSTTKLDGTHQALSFLPKCECEVKQVEFAKAWRLTNSSVEPVSFTVPRVRMEYFQDDLFPDTAVTWEPVMTSDQWFSGANKKPKTISLKPKDMTSLSEAPVEAPKVKKFESYNPDTYKTDEQKKEELMSAVTKKLTKQEAPLPQDLAEGVDDDEWDDY